VVKVPVRERRHRRAVGLEENDPPARSEHLGRLVEEAGRSGEVVEDVDQDEVRDRALRVRQAFRVHHGFRPRSWLDVGRKGVRDDFPEAADAGAELDDRA
jgi:hypothetical protein